MSSRPPKVALQVPLPLFRFKAFWATFLRRFPLFFCVHTRPALTIVSGSNIILLFRSTALHRLNLFRSSFRAQAACPNPTKRRLNSLHCFLGTQQLTSGKMARWQWLHLRSCIGRHCTSDFRGISSTDTLRQTCSYPTHAINGKRR